MANPNYVVRKLPRHLIGLALGCVLALAQSHHALAGPAGKSSQPSNITKPTETTKATAPARAVIAAGSGSEHRIAKIVKELDDPDDMSGSGDDLDELMDNQPIKKISKSTMKKLPATNFALELPQKSV